MRVRFHGNMQRHQVDSLAHQPCTINQVTHFHEQRSTHEPSCNIVYYAFVHDTTFLSSIVKPNEWQALVGWNATWRDFAVNIGRLLSKFCTVTSTRLECKTWSHHLTWAPFLVSYTIFEFTYQKHALSRLSLVWERCDAPILSQGSQSSHFLLHLDSSPHSSASVSALMSR